MKQVATLLITITSNERFFSALGRVKNYLRLKMGNNRPSSFMILGVEKEETLDLDRLVDDLSKQLSRY